LKEHEAAHRDHRAVLLPERGRRLLRHLGARNQNQRRLAIGRIHHEREGLAGADRGQLAAPGRGAQPLADRDVHDALGQRRVGGGRVRAQRKVKQRRGVLLLGRRGRKDAVELVAEIERNVQLERRRASDRVQLGVRAGESVGGVAAAAAKQAVQTAGLVDRLERIRCNGGLGDSPAGAFIEPVR
jgi:hypothetical protein